MPLPGIGEGLELGGRRGKARPPCGLSCVDSIWWNMQSEEDEQMIK